MRKNMEILKEIQHNYDVLKQSSEIFKDTSSIKRLREIKINFEQEKINYKSLFGKLQEITKKYKLIENKINLYNKELEEKKQLLYNGCGSNLKLIDKLQKEIQIYENDIKCEENKQFELLEAEEKFKYEIEASKKKIVNLKKSFCQIKEEASQRKFQSETDYKNAKEAISRLEKEVPQFLIKKFYDIQRIKDDPIVELKNGVCSGCKISVSIMTINELKLNKGVVTCDNCGRMLYIK